MAVESIWKVRPAAQKFATDANSSVPVVRHPLEENEDKSKLSGLWSKKTRSEPKEEAVEKYDFEDPLGATFGDSNEKIDKDILQETKPRSFSLDNTLENRKTDRSTFDIDLPDFQPWREKRAQIAAISRPKEFGMSQIDLVKARLKLLADEKSLRTVKRAGEVSQQFLNNRENLISSWIREDRVEAFKIVIESTHLLQSIPPYSEEYPYYWLLAIDVIDTFGKLVYDRLLMKSNEARNKIGQTDLQPSFSVEQVPKTVKDMAMNWFLKLSEIIDIPVRFYIECSMIACLKFFDDSNLDSNFERLALMCSQFPDDISSIFARVHISRYSMLISPLNRATHWRVLHDWMQAPKDVMEEAFRKKTSLSDVRKQLVSIQGVSWIVQCVSYGALTVDDLVPLFAYCRKTPIDEKTFVLVSAVVEGLAGKYLAVHADQILDIVFALHTDFEDPLVRLGRRFSAVPPFEENRKFVKSSRSVWMRVADIADFQSFVDCCTAWIGFIAKFYSTKDVHNVLELVLVRLKVDEKTKKTENTRSLIDLISAFIENVPEIGEALKIATSTDFINLVDLIGHDMDANSKCSQRILEILVRRCERRSVRDIDTCRMIVEKCGTACRRCGLEENDDVRAVERLVCSALSLIDFQSIADRNQSVELIVRCREDLGLRQEILAHIIDTLFAFTQFTHASAKTGKRKSDFMRVCITNLSLTIPAIRDVGRRTRMTIQNVQMCLLANFLPQIDMSCERIQDYLESLSSQCSAVGPLINQYLSVLCQTPDGFHDSFPSLKHFSKLQQFVERNHDNWLKEAKGVPLAEIYVNMLRYLVACRQVDPLNSVGSQHIHSGHLDHLTIVDASISDVITRLFSLANEPVIAVITLENVVMLFQMHEEMRSTIRGLLKRSVGAPEKLQKRLELIIGDLRIQAATDQSVHDILQRLSIL